MPRLIYPLVAAGMLSFAPMALAETTQGIVDTIDTDTMTLTLSDGSIFQLPAYLVTAELAPGTQVEVIWEMQDGRPVVSDIVIVE